MLLYPLLVVVTAASMTRCQAALYPGEGTSRIAGYQTKSTITGSTIDLDQAVMEYYLNQGDFATAQRIYQQGAHMQAYAVLTLDDDGSNNNNNNYRPSTNSTTVVAWNEAGDTVIYGQMAGGSTSRRELYVTYRTDRNNVPCSVGGHPHPQTKGCFAPRGGLLLQHQEQDAISSSTLTYHYDVLQDNRFWGSLWGFSEHEAEQVFHDCHTHKDCPYPEYKKFIDYYGQLDYAVVWMDSLFAGGASSTSLSHPYFNVGLLTTMAGRAEAIRMGTVTLHVRMQVNRILTEWSMDQCSDHCTTAFCPEATLPWDLAVATYAGSLVGSEGEGEGRLLYSLANELCSDFGTCGAQKSALQGTSAVNLDIVSQFQHGRRLLEAGKCLDAQLVYGKIVHLMTVPLIQGTLRSAYRLQYLEDKDSDQERGRALALASSILPDLNSCSPQDAELVHAQFSTTGMTPDFASVKAAFERNYECLSVQCEDVGGFYNAKKAKYYPGATPCGTRRVSEHNRHEAAGARHGWIRSLAVLVLASVSLVVVAISIPWKTIPKQLERSVRSYSPPGEEDFDEFTIELNEVPA